jgi:hypothetical protein
LPVETRKILLFVPYHHYFQPAEGSREAEIWRECKDRTTRLAANTENLYVLDFMIESGITTRDTNYWDHKQDPNYRILHP